MNMTPSPVMRRRQRGAMLWLTVSLLLSLSLTALLGLSFARVGFYHAFGLKHRVQATYMADAGLNVAYLKISNLSTLGSLTLPYAVVPETVLGTGSYKVELLNNPGDTGGATDTDGVYVIQSTGWSEGKSARRVLQSRLRASASTGLRPPGVLTLGNNTHVKFSTVSLNGHDPDPTVPAVAGIAYEKTGQSWEHGSATVSGNPDYSWAAAAFTTGTGFSAQAQQYLNTMAAKATAVHKSGSSNSALGTTAVPQITVIDASSTYQASSAISGVGVLIVRGKFEPQGGLNYTGLILIEGNAGEMKAGGSCVLSGAMVITPPSGSGVCTNFESTNSANFVYQKSKLDMFPSASPSSGLQLGATVFLN